MLPGGHLTAYLSYLIQLSKHLSQELSEVRERGEGHWLLRLHSRNEDRAETPGVHVRGWESGWQGWDELSLGSAGAQRAGRGGASTAGPEGGKVVQAGLQKPGSRECPQA